MTHWIGLNYVGLLLFVGLQSLCSWLIGRRYVSSHGRCVFIYNILHTNISATLREMVASFLFLFYFSRSRISLWAYIYFFLISLAQVSFWMDSWREDHRYTEALFGGWAKVANFQCRNIAYGCGVYVSWSWNHKKNLTIFSTIWLNSM